MVSFSFSLINSIPLSLYSHNIGSNERTFGASVSTISRAYTSIMYLTVSIQIFWPFSSLICWFYILQLQNFSVGEFVGFAAEGHTILEFCLISSPLKEAFPELFNIAQIRHALVADLLWLSNGVIHCNLTFAQSVQD
jgi:hypothetical protein